MTCPYCNAVVIAITGEIESGCLYTAVCSQCINFVVLDSGKLRKPKADEIESPEYLKLASNLSLLKFSYRKASTAVLN
jgi:hypothetical protein